MATPQGIRQTDMLARPTLPMPFVTSDLGHSINIESGVLFAASPSTSANGARGIVARFFGSGGAFSQVETFALPNPGGGDLFGWALDRRGSVVVASAVGRRVMSTDDAGAVYVIEESGGAWTLLGTELTAPSLSGDDSFGHSVATDATWIAVGAMGDDSIATDAGKVHMYRKDSSGIWTHFSEVVSTLPMNNARFGVSVALDGGRLAVGSHLNGDGLVEVFDFDAGTGSWTHSWSQVPVNGTSLDQFGFSVSLDGDRLAIGGPLGGAANFGYVEVFEFAFGGWNFAGHLGHTNSNTRTLGRDVSIHGDCLIAGAPSGPVGGFAYVYSRSSSGTWGLDRVIVPAESEVGSSAGYSVDVDGGELAVSGRLHTQWNNSRGAIWLYEKHDQPIVSSGFGDGSVAPCPCGNDSVPGRDQGCVNSSSLGAELIGLGSASLAANDLRFDMRNGLPSNAALLFVGTSQSAAPPPIGDGLLFSAGSLLRLDIAFPSAQGTARWSAGFAGQQGWAAGQTLTFQAWYRDPFGPCGTGFSSSNSVQVTFNP